MTDTAISPLRRRMIAIRQRLRDPEIDQKQVPFWLDYFTIRRTRAAHMMLRWQGSNDLATWADERPGPQSQVRGLPDHPEGDLAIDVETVAAIGP
jgi:hypothetical protein